MAEDVLNTPRGYANASVAWLNSPRGDSNGEINSTISVEQLRRLLRSDVQEVVRVELQAAAASGWALPQAQGTKRPRESWRAEEEHSPGTSSRKKQQWRPGLRLSQQFGSKTQSQDVSDEEGRAASEHYALLAEVPRASFAQMGDQMMRCFRLVDKVWRLEEPCKEPIRKGALAEFINSNAFHMFFAVLVAANAGFMVYAANQDVQNVCNNTDKAALNWMWNVDMLFLVLFTIEVVCKLAVHRLFYFWNRDAFWNWLDFFLVLQTFVLSYMESSHLEKGGHNGDRWMRMFRIFKAARILRILRIFTFVSELNLIFSAIIGTVMHLFWSLVVFAILFLTFSMYFTSSVATYLEEIGSADGQTEKTVILYFGSVGTSFMTLFMTVFGGEDWGEFYAALLPMGGRCHYLYIGFVAFSNLALLNIVTGFFVERAVKISQPDVHQLAEERFTEEREYAMELRRLFGLADKDGDGLADKEELENMVREGRIINYLRYLNIDPAWSKRHLMSIFDEVAERAPGDDFDGVSAVSITALVERVMAVRGFARSTDIMDLYDMVWRVESLQQQMMNKIDGMSE
jgi:hypothetical protein